MVRPFRVVIVCGALTGVMTFAAGLSAITVINRESGLQTLEVGSGREPLVLPHGYGSSAPEWLPYTQTIRAPFDGSHEFPANVVTALNAFLARSSAPER